MKKIAIFAVIAIIIFSLIGCDESDESDDDDSNNNEISVSSSFEEDIVEGDETFTGFDTDTQYSDSGYYEVNFYVSLEEGESLGSFSFYLNYNSNAIKFFSVDHNTDEDTGFNGEDVHHSDLGCLYIDEVSPFSSNEIISKQPKNLKIVTVTFEIISEEEKKNLFVFCVVLSDVEGNTIQQEI